MVQKRKPSSNLITSIKRRKWNDVQHYLHEAKHADDTDTFPLHHICFDKYAPMKIVNDIYQAYPEAALAKDSCQYTPISLAVEAGFEDAVNLLATKCPESSIICGQLGISPVQSAIYGSDSNTMIDSIIRTNPKAAFVPDDEGESAFDLFFRQWNICMRQTVSFNSIISNELLEHSTGRGDWKIQDIYAKTCIFLKAAYLYRNKQIASCNLSNYLLHSALREESCHWSFCNLIMRLHPEQILVKDNNGNLPIHIIAASNKSSDEDTFLCTDCFMRHNELICMEYVNGDTRYCCKDCFEFEPIETIKKAFEIKPGECACVFLLGNK